MLIIIYFVRFSNAMQSGRSFFELVDVTQESLKDAQILMDFTTDPELHPP